MNRNMIVPALIAGGLHGLLLGFKPAPTVVQPPESADKVELIQWKIVEDPEVVDLPIVTALSDDEIQRPKPTDAYSGLEELPIVTNVDPGVITIILPPRPAIEGEKWSIIPSDFRPGTPGGPGGGSVSLLGDLDNHPRALLRTPPTRPPGARAADALITVEFVVGRDGAVARAEVVASSDHQFDEPCLRAVRRWRFEPGIKHGLPVSFRVAQDFVFNTGE